MCGAFLDLPALEWLFAKKDLPTPCFIIDEKKLRENCRILDEVQRETGAKILLALKAYAAWPTFRLLSSRFDGPLKGVCASSVDEARLGREDFGGEVHAFAAAWSDAEFAELLKTADCVVFNSLGQWRKFRQSGLKANATFRKDSPIHFGLRLNPEHSEGAAAIYDPCSPGSRLGLRKKELEKARPEDLAGITGLHFHTLCEQNADSLERTLKAFEEKFGPWLKNLEWLNFGGGHHITREDYDLELLKKLLREWAGKTGAQIYLEPGEAVALNAGWLAAEVLDIVEADMPVAILDTSAACHMPDVLEMPYTPPVWQNANGPVQAGSPGEYAWNFRLAGKSCLAGDNIGEYSFKRRLKPGDRLIFGDMAIYSMVKTTTFNGLRLPSIALLHHSEKGYELEVIREFGYEDFWGRLG